MTICVDWDRTIHDTDNPPDGGRLGPPLPGARDALTLLHNLGHIIVIHSCARPSVIEKWMSYFEIPYDYIWDERGKPVADCYLDDLGLRFTSWDQALKDLGAL